MTFNRQRLVLWLLDGHEPVPCEDVLTWGAAMERAREAGHLAVAQEHIAEIFVSTVFLGVDHNYGLYGDPVLFETMAFCNDESISCDRYCTWAEAEAGHLLVAATARHQATTAELAGIDLLATLMIDRK